MLIQVIALLAMSAATRGTRSFAADSAATGIAHWEAFTVTIGITGLVLATLALEHRLHKDRLVRLYETFANKVRKRSSQVAAMNHALDMEVARRRHLEGELIRAEEHQQRMLGRNLHDGLGQHLTSIALFGATLQQRLEAQNHPEASHALRIVDLINQANDMVRAVSRGLYPAILETAGLNAALEQLADTTCQLRNVACEFRANAPVAADDPLVAINLYRIAQEAVNNALRHGNASHILIKLDETESTYRLLIQDNGTGFDLATVSHGDGMGLRNAHYRADILDGVLKVSSHPCRGTIITAVVPKKSRTP
ncbi:MAG: hypothetical protein CVU19_12185 [Betaproteobacteria bacterium HGW-Betaproteobacteria-13]|nr:MAG: hypothetical protein CVU19_12185 [Betaproteobacteria bacterium HGW-Betaproteobacteria-13]